jgi:hypothetical protein
LFLGKLLAAHQAGSLKVFGDHGGLADAGAFTAFLAPLRKAEWVVDAKKPLADRRPRLQSHVSPLPRRRLQRLD